VKWCHDRSLEVWSVSTTTTPIRWRVYHHHVPIVFIMMLPKNKSNDINIDLIKSNLPIKRGCCIMFRDATFTFPPTAGSPKADKCNNMVEKNHPYYHHPTMTSINHDSYAYTQLYYLDKERELTDN
jgi:hypothetical protein